MKLSNHRGESGRLSSICIKYIHLETTIVYNKKLPHNNETHYILLDMKRREVIYPRRYARVRYVLTPPVKCDCQEVFFVFVQVSATWHMTIFILIHPEISAVKQLPQATA